MSAEIAQAMRDRLEAALLPALRARYPGRAVRIDWDEADALGNRQASGQHGDGVEDAA